MTKIIKKYFAGVIAFIMAFSLVPNVAFAAEEESTETSTETSTEAGIEAFSSGNRVISVGHDHTMVIIDGRLWGWGLNTSGQLGDGTTTNRSTFVEITHDDVDAWESVSAGGAHTMAIDTAGRLWAWGNNDQGRLGTGTAGNSNVPIQVGINTWNSVSAGTSHTVAIRSDNTLWAWGSNADGRLGIGYAPATAPQRPQPALVSGDAWVYISAGDGHTLAIQEGGTLWAWGNNGQGRLGDDSTTARNAPVQIGTNDDWVSVTAGGSHSIGIRDGNSMWAWGSNTGGRFGAATPASSNVPIEVDFLWRSVTTGIDHTLAIAPNGALWSWGANAQGQLGRPTGTNAQVGTFTDWEYISAGRVHSVAIRSDGSIWTWGNNANAQLGNGTTVTPPVASNLPQRVYMGETNIVITVDGEPEASPVELDVDFVNTAVLNAVWEGTSAPPPATLSWEITWAASYDDVAFLGTGENTTATGNNITLTANDHGSAVVTVTSNGGITNYIEVIVSPATDAALSDLSLSIGEIDFVEGTRNYTVTVPYSYDGELVDSVVVTATPRHPAATIAFAPGATVPIGNDPVVITITVTAQDEVSNEVYTITVSRAAPTLSFDLDPAEITISNDPEDIQDINIVETVDVLSNAVGDIAVSYSLPTGVTATISDGTVTVTGTRPFLGEPNITGTGTVTISYGGVTAVLDVTVNLTPMPPPLLLTPDTITINAANSTHRIEVDGTTTGAITWSTPDDWPAEVQINLSGESLYIFGTRPAAGSPAITGGPFIVEVTRQNVVQNLTVSAIDLQPLAAAPTVTLTPASIAITYENNTASFNVGGTATGTISVSAINGITAEINQVTGEITITGTRPLPGQNPVIGGPIPITVSRQGANAEIIIDINLNAPPPPPTIVLPTAPVNITDANPAAVVNVLGSATGAISVSTLPPGVAMQIDQALGTITFTGTRPQMDSPNISVISFPLTITRADAPGISATLSMNVNLTAQLTAVPTMTASPTSVNIINTGLTASTIIGGTATGYITLNTGNLPAAITATVNQVSGAVTITGVRPPLGGTAIVDTFQLTATRPNGASVQITINVNLSPLPAPPSLILSQSTVNITADNPFSIITISGDATGSFSVTPTSMPSGVSMSLNQAAGTITFVGVRPAQGQAPHNHPPVQLTVTRQGATQNITLNVNLQPQTTAPPTLQLTASSVSVTGANLTPTTNVVVNAVTSSATGPVTLTGLGTLPSGVTAAANAVTGEITVTGVRPQHHLPAITGTFTINVHRQGAIVPLEIVVDIPPLPAPSLTFNPNPVNITNDNLSVYVDIEGEATGMVSVAIDPAYTAPAGVTWSSTSPAVLRVSATQPTYAMGAINETFNLLITRNNVTQPLQVNVNLQPTAAPSFDISPSAISLNENNMSAVVSLSGTATGSVTLTMDGGSLPPWLNVTQSTADETLTFTATRPSYEVGDIDGAISIVITRQGVSQTLTINADIEALPPEPPSVLINPSTVTINNSNLEATAVVAGTADSEITLDTSALPEGITAEVDQATGIITVIGERPEYGESNISGEFAIIVTREDVSATLTVNANLTNLPQEPVFVPVTSISLSQTNWEIGVDYHFDEFVSILPTRRPNDYPTIENIIWSVVSVSNNDITANVRAADNTLLTAGRGHTTITVRATIPAEYHGGEEFTQNITLTFSSQVVIATLEGLHSLFAGVPVVGSRVLFTLQEGHFHENFTPSDFFVGNLPIGLSTEPAVRISDTEIAVNIVGTPVAITTERRTLIVPSSIHQRNIWQGTRPAPVIAQALVVGGTTASAAISQHAFTFDLNPLGTQHRDFTVTLDVRGLRLVNIRYGTVNLREDTDFSRAEFNDYQFTIHTSFLSRLPLGEWEITFIMNRGANPVVRINVIDSSLEVETPPEIVVGPPPAPPETPLHPDENFMFLSGGASVNLENLRWDLDRARVSPTMLDGVAYITVSTHVLDHMAWEMPDTSFEIMTPLARVRVPSNILDLIFGGRSAIIANGLNYHQADLRITITDRSEDEVLTGMFAAIYPYGEILTSLLDIQLEIIETDTNRVLLTATELSRPIRTSFVVMNNAGHLRPAGVMFSRNWLEFIPYRMPSPNEVVTSSIFPGVQGVVHNRVHFEDVYLMHWGFVESYAAAVAGLVAPMENLYPYTPITRGEFAQLLSFALQLPRAGAETSGFVDVLPPNTFFDGVSRLSAAGLLGPRTNGARFYPDAIITREEIAAIVGMALTVLGPERMPEERPLAMAFVDFESFNLLHRDNVQITVNYGVMSGHPDNTFRPRENATRIQALHIVMNLARALGLLDEI